MLYRKRLLTLLIPALFCLGACSTQDLRSETEAETAATATADERVALHLRELTSDRAELLSRRNGIESEPDRHQPEVTADPN